MSAPSEYVAFDLETTGLSPKSDRVLEIGAVRFDLEMRRLREMELVVDPGVPIPHAEQRLVGQDAADIEGAPAPVEGVAQLADFCEGAELVAHGAGFDITFCAGLVPAAFGRRRVLDTLELARCLLPVAASHSLPLLSAALAIEHKRPHRALSDASATYLLFAQLRAAAEALPAGVLAQIRRVAAQAGGELGHFFAEVVRTDGDPQRRSWAGSQRGAPPPPPPTGPPPADIVATATALLGPSGPLADELGYELRETQLEMTRAVGQAVQRRRRLLVEAGTGVGKSLAYLVPLALNSRNGRRAVVATRTITLQEQLMNRDLPMVERIVGAPVPVALLKGRNHQLSLRRWHRFLQSPDTGPHGPDLDRIRFKLKLLSWLAETKDGDRGELHLNGVDEALWRHVESDGGDCLGAACANWQGNRCFMVAARRTAESASIVITNHALLLADAAGGGHALGEHEVLVIDEAHHLEEAATDQLGVNLRAGDVLLVVDRLGIAEGALGAALAAAREAAIRLFGDVKGRIGEVVGADHSGNAIVGLSAEVREGHGHLVLRRSAQHAVECWHTAAARLREEEHASSLQIDMLPQPERADQERLLAATALDELALAVEWVLLRPREQHVAWLALRAEQGELHEAPVSVADALRESVFTRADTVVATSATLAVAGDFGFTSTRLGLDGADELLLNSPYDFFEQALCVLPADVPPYDDPEYDRALATLIGDVADRLGGSTLALFTGYNPLRRVHALLGQRMEASGIALLGQGLDGTRRQILASFLANQRTVLLGTSSFWEGIDVPGDALRCVVIAKLPFAVPSDPLVRARTQSLADPFGQYILPQAVLRLRQGFGRLIRRGNDRGAVVLCDERLRSRDYGERFLQALPPAAVATLPVADVGEAVADFVLQRRVPEVTQLGASHRQSAQDHRMHEDPA
ncbi:MAG: helicase C-terminal domain-containing protein [Candidatus Dormibacteria bacterium]